MAGVQCETFTEEAPGNWHNQAVKQAVEDHEVRGHKRILTLSATLSSVRKMPLALITLCVT